MAANSKSTQGIASLGKRVFSQIWTANNSNNSARFASSSASARRAAHTSAYDKNIDDQVCPAAVPDDVIQPESEKYWEPHPQTGVFGPATGQNSAAGREGASSSNSGQNSVLEEKAWFRPTSLEDLEKPSHA